MGDDATLAKMRGNLVSFERPAMDRSAGRCFLSCFLPVTVLFVLFCLADFGAAATEQAKFSTRIDDVDGSLFPRIDGLVTIFSRKAVPQLSRDDFTVDEDGTKIFEFEVRVDERPLYLSLVLDRSGSMKGAMTELKAAASRFIELLEERAVCQLISFSSEVTPHGYPGLSRVMLLDAVKALRPAGETALYDAVSKGIDSIASYSQRSRRVVVAFTDGVDQNREGTQRLSRMTARAMVEKARKARVALYFIGLGESVNRKLMTKAAQLTGGAFFSSPTKKELSLIFARLAVNLRASYRLRYETPKPARDGSWRRVSITSRIRGMEDQGQGRYQAPEKEAEPPEEATSASLPRQGKPDVHKGGALKWEALAIEFKPLDVMSSLKLYHPAKGLSQEDVREESSALHEEYLEVFQSFQKGINDALAPIFQSYQAKLAAKDYEGLVDLSRRAKATLDAGAKERERMIAAYEKDMTPFARRIQPKWRADSYLNCLRCVTQQVNVRFAAYRTTLTVNLTYKSSHNETWRREVEDYNRRERESEVRSSREAESR